MAQMQLPRVDTAALSERLREVDLPRLSDLGDEFRRLGLADVARGLDLDALRRLDVAEGLRHLDLEALRRLDVEGLAHDGLRQLSGIVERPELDLAPLRDLPAVRAVARRLGRDRRKRRLWQSLPGTPPVSATIAAGALVVLAGAAAGCVVAWLYQPGKGDRRRAAIRRRLGRGWRKVKRAVTAG